MASKSKGAVVYMVTRPDTQTGGSMRGDSPQDAARRALRCSWMKGARCIQVRSFAGTVGERALFLVGRGGIISEVETVEMTPEDRYA